MPTSAPKSQKIIGGLGDLHVNNWQENKGKISTITLHLVSRDFQRLDRNPTELKKQS